MREADAGWLGGSPRPRTHCCESCLPMPPGGNTVSETTSHTEGRDLSPTPEFAAQANGKADLYDAAAADFEGFWAEQARNRLSWAKDFDQTLDWSGAPLAKWFVGGEVNAAYNCVDRHVEAGNGDRVAIHFEGEG